ncbi:SAM-dependent methyltransferase [Actinosynnema sp. NPDC004786]
MTLTDLQSLPIEVVRGPRTDPYEDKVAAVYADDPEEWRKVIGDELHFQWGVYNHPDSPRPVSLDEAGRRHLDRQLELAGFTGRTPTPRRVLDLGCGWGADLRALARRFPDARRLDGVNISRRQLEHCARALADDRRVHLYQANARDVALLPDPGDPYDLTVVRGAITHFPMDVLREAIAGLSARVRGGGLLVISDNLYNVDLDTYTSAIPDRVDRLACRHRKTPADVTGALEAGGFAVEDIRVLPSNTDVARSLLETRSNLETHFPEGVTGALEELRVMAVNLSIAVLKNEISAYSIIARRR